MNKEPFKSPIIIIGLVLFALIAVVGILRTGLFFQAPKFDYTSFYAFLVDSQVLVALPLILIAALFILSRICSKPKLAAIGLFLLGIGMIVRFSFGMVGILDFNAHKVEVVGTVSALVERVKQPCRKYETCLNYYPQVTFQAKDGAVVTFEDTGSISDLISSNLFSFGSIDPLEIKAGDSVPVSYDTRNPAQAHVGNSISTFLILIDIGMILVVFILGFITFMFPKKSTKIICGQS